MAGRQGDISPARRERRSCVLLWSTMACALCAAGLSPAAVSGMVRAFGSAHKLRVGAGCALASLAFWDAVAAGSRGRREGGCAVTALDLGGCRSLTADSLVYAFDAIGTLRWGARCRMRRAACKQEAVV